MLQRRAPLPLRHRGGRSSGNGMSTAPAVHSPSQPSRLRALAEGAQAGGSIVRSSSLGRWRRHVSRHIRSSSLARARTGTEPVVGQEEPFVARSAERARLNACAPQPGAREHGETLRHKKRKAHASRVRRDIQAATRRDATPSACARTVARSKTVTTADGWLSVMSFVISIDISSCGRRHDDATIESVEEGRV